MDGVHYFPKQSGILWQCPNASTNHGPPEASTADEGELTFEQTFSEVDTLQLLFICNFIIVYDDNDLIDFSCISSIERIKRRHVRYVIAHIASGRLKVSALRSMQILHHDILCTFCRRFILLHALHR